VKPVDLRAASDRLRENPPAGFPKRAGRPRKRPIGTSENGSAAPAAGTLRAQTPARTRKNTARGDGDGVLQTPALSAARLLDLRSAATYLGLAPWTTRELEWSGVLRRVRVPLPKGGELRKVLFDRADLDLFIAAWKESTP
jgi:hypothetical protein